MGANPRTIDDRAVGVWNAKKNEVVISTACKNLLALSSIEYRVERFGNLPMMHWRLVCRAPGDGWRRDFLISSPLWEVKMWIDNLSRD